MVWFDFSVQVERDNRNVVFYRSIFRRAYKAPSCPSIPDYIRVIYNLKAPYFNVTEDGDMDTRTIEGKSRYLVTSVPDPDPYLLDPDPQVQFLKDWILIWIWVT